MELFENFKENYSDLKLSIKMWESATDVEIFKSEKSGWSNLNTSNFDGNPIAVYYNFEEKRGIRIIQILQSENGERKFDFWKDNFGDEKTIYGKELVFSMTPTELNIERYKKIVSIWLNNINVTLGDLTG